MKSRPLEKWLTIQARVLDFFKNVSFPISLSRGAYWLGATYEKLGNKEKSDQWFKEGAKFLTTYYGQLSHMKIYPNETFKLNDLMNIDKNSIEKFNTSELVKIIYLLDELDKDKYTKHILRHIALENITSGTEILSAKLGKLKSFAHWIYFEECRPEDRIKWPSNNALVFFKIFKDFLCESISFFFVSNYLKFYTLLF